jgi:hypothetical protein
MTGERTTNRRLGSSWSKRIARQHLAGAIRYAMIQTRASQASAAAWCQKSERTVRNWLSERSAVDVEAVLRSARLRRPFLRYLQVCDQKEAA